MTISQQATDGLLKALKFMHPEYGGLIDFLTGHETELMAAGPLIQAAATEGPGAFAAAEKAAPELAAAIRGFVAATPAASSNPKATSLHAEKLTRQIVGAPPLTPEGERQFLSQDSRSGSG